MVDAVYNPLRTNLILGARQRGLPAEGGLYMLAAQAVYASALFTGTNAEEALIQQAYASVLAQKRNLVLIGMPSCGKTTVGRILARQTGHPLLDTDEIIAQRAGRSIPDIFALEGEAAFRAMEREAVAEAGKQSGVVIATGGGVPLDDRNVAALRQNGVLIFLNRPLDALQATPDRPLSCTVDALRKRYEERLPRYSAVCDVRIDGSESPDDAARQVLHAIGEDE